MVSKTNFNKSYNLVIQEQDMSQGTERNSKCEHSIENQKDVNQDTCIAEYSYRRSEQLLNICLICKASKKIDLASLM